MNVLDILIWLDERVSRTADLCPDSRKLRDGDVFFAYPGIAGDGRAHMQAAAAAGAAAIVRAAGGDWQVPQGIPVLEVPDLTALLGEVGHRWYGRPSDVLMVIAVTGTNGKTSVAQWIAAALNAGGLSCGTVGTLGVILPDGRNLGGVLTTPDVLTLHRSLALIARAGAVAAAIEASSIGLDQGRLAGVRVRIAGFTNLTRDHLDYHGTPERYKQAKFLLFGRPDLQVAVINADDAAGSELLAGQAPAGRRVGYSLGATGRADFSTRALRHDADGLAFHLVTPYGEVPVTTHLLGEHNASNLLLVAGVLCEMGWAPGRIARALERLRPVPGRLQVVTAPVGGPPIGPLAVVDYAHTPDALEHVLTALRPVAGERSGKLICVFGCGGDRDTGKRPLMGAIAARLADQVVVTTDNPRTEDPLDIIHAIVAGMPGAPRVEVDRASAILESLWRAAPSDVVLLAGKGHETYQEVRHVRSPFDDREWARMALGWRQGMRLSTDTRTLQPGDLFLALQGERHDGHDYLTAAARGGAAAAIVAHPVAGATLPQIVLGDTLRALQRLATAWRRQFVLPVIAVTGSNGKTTTKEMIAAILAAWLGEPARLATRGNLNNAIGVPLSVLRLTAAHRAAVLELGMNHPGEIAVLAAIAQPTVALVNNAQREHQEFMTSVEAVARENGSAISALPADGVAVFPACDAWTPLWRAMAGSRTVRCFGPDPQADVRASQIRFTAEGSEFRLDLGAEAVSVTLQAPGQHNVHNALAAATCAWVAGAPIAAIRAGLAAFRPVSGRSQSQLLPDGFQLIDDSYNANPDSVRAAIDVLAALAGRRILILGDMAEVGEQGPAMHAEVGAYARERGVDVLLTLGCGSRQAAAAFGADAFACDGLEALLAQVRAARPGHILVKGSRSMHMERVVQALQARPAIDGGRHAA